MDGMDPTVITAIADYFRRELHYNIPPRTPYVGEDFNITRAGVHADGLMKNEEVYNIFDTEKLLGRAPKVMVNNTSGDAGIAAWVNRHLGLTGEDAFNKKDSVVIRLREWVDEQYNEGRVTHITDNELKDQLNIIMKEEMASLR
jgi:isopropylmalate/homocitrate/citramalate synthase